MGQQEEWYTLDDIQLNETDDSKLFCLSVDSPDKQFLAGKIGVPTHNTDEGKEQDAMKGEAQMIIGSIARLGRAAGVHLVIATQRPDATLIPGETKANLGVRINAGRTDTNASSMILGNGEGTRVRPNPKGRLYLRIYSNGDHGQGFFAQQEWIDEYLASKGLNPDGTPISSSGEKDKEYNDDLGFTDGEAGLDDITDTSSASFGESNSSSSPSLSNLQDGSSVSNFEGRELRLSNGVGDSDKWHRPEDDWDDTMDFIADNNFSDDEE